MRRKIGTLLEIALRPAVALSFIIYYLSFSPAGAQGLPLIRNYSAAEYGGHNRSYDIEIGADGTVFVANFEGLLYYDRVRWRIIYTPDISRITVVYRDSKDTLWVGGYNFFARLQQRANGELYMQQLGQDGQFDGEVMEIFEEDGLLQFVASDNNIYKVKGSTISLKEHTKANFSPGVESDVISLKALKEGGEDVILDDITQTEDLDGGLRVKVKKNYGLIICDNLGRDLYSITEANGLCSNQVAYVAYDGHGMLWGATAHGIFSIEIPSVYSYFLPKDGLSGEVHAIAAFDGKIYVGGTNGLFSIASRQCKRIPDINNICWTLCQSRGALLVATSSGIYKIAPGGNVTRLTSNATTAMLVDGDKVYAGEPDAVYCYEASKMVNGQKVAELPLVTEIRQDAHGNLWFRNVHGETKGTDPGKPYEPVADLSPHLLTPISDIEIQAQFRHGDQIWIGGDEVLAIIDTSKKELATLTDNRNVRFCSILMGNDSVLWGGYGDMPKKLKELDSDEGHLHFFYALEYAPLSGKTLYRYKLNSNKWSAWTDKQDLEYLNLPYGSFTLSVQAQLANGELSEVASVDFSIAYPLLMRWYMVIVYCLLFIVLVYLLFRYRLKRLQKEKIKLEQIVEERTSEVVKQKDEIVRQKDEIEEKSKSLEKALDELNNAQNELIRQEKMATVGKLTEGLIDRILNPMNYIINFSKMSNELLKDLKENIDNNKDNINEDDYEDTLDVLGMLTDNLQSVNKYGQNTTRILKAMEEMLKDRTSDYISMDLLPVLHQDKEILSKFYAKEKEQYHIHTPFTLPDASMPLHGNPEMLSKTIMSILGNATYAVIKKAQRMFKNQPVILGMETSYIPEVSLTATIVDGQYIVKIRDNGIGIEEKILGKIFDPFFTTKTTDEAAGVGLYLSREVIQNHGGDISVASVKDEYTEITITLPGANSGLRPK
ncbi:MAG: HAMP domain-containing histidine kinase [Prevotella sp.]|nr:HAMP domain-containing histidine kinase [Prevotella sp.]